MTRLMMLWDCCNVLGETFKLRPMVMPLHATTNAVCGSTAADFALAASMVMAMLRVLARDVLSEDGTPLLGWEPWLCAVADDARL